MEISFPHFKSHIYFDSPEITHGERAKWFLFFITQIVEFRGEMTIPVLKDRLYSLGYETTIDEIEEYFSNDPDIRPSKTRSNAFEIKPSSRKKLFSELNKDQKVFLSHSSENKPLVRQVDKTLRTLGCDTWLDENAMTAGKKLERSLLEGMKSSCAAVFFVTPEFKDENFLATEVDYAISEKRRKGERFQIITIVISSEDGKKGKVPELLKPFVWKEPKSEFEIVEEIIKSLPLKISVTGWKDELA